MRPLGLVAVLFRTAPGSGSPNAARFIRRMLGYQREGLPSQGSYTPLPIFCCVEAQHAAFQVYVWPAQSQQLPTSGTRSQGQDHNRVQI